MANSPIPNSNFSDLVDAYGVFREVIVKRFREGEVRDISKSCIFKRKGEIVAIVPKAGVVSISVPKTERMMSAPDR